MVRGRRPSLKDPRGERAQFLRRAIAGFLLIALSLGALVARYIDLQVVHYSEFALRSDSNRIRPRAIPPARGLIYDRNGVLLADNVPAFRLEVVPDKVSDMSAMLTRLAQVVPLDPDDIAAFLRQVKRSRSFDSIPLKMHLSEDDIARFAVNRWRFPGVDVVPYLTRYYPLGPLFAQVVGYVGRIDENDLAHLDPKLYEGTTHIGKRGVERAYESVLHGTPGYELDEVNADGKVQRVLLVHPPIPGKNLYLSLDVRLQKAATEAFDGRPGAAVAIDPRNGQVLAMVSVPSFDPNLFVNGISKADYAALNDDPQTPMINRAMNGAYPPGSTVKPFIALGGLELGLRRPQDTVLSTGQFCLPNQPRCYRDDSRYGDGVVNMVRAIELSTNTYFYKLALDMGIERFDAWMRRFDFGQRTGIDLIGESTGILPSPAWKRAHFRQPWYPGETVMAGIGQSYWTVTPLQLAHAIATFAGHGVPYAPRVVMAERAGPGTPIVPLDNPPEGPSLIGSPADWAVVNQGMRAVITGGTGKGLNDGFPYPIAGKSGTAERFSRYTDAYNTDKNTAYLASRHRAWFEAYTPSDDPRIAAAALLEAGAWGASAAGPIVRRIFDAWLAEHKNDPGMPPPSLPVAPPKPVLPAGAGSTGMPASMAAPAASGGATGQAEDLPAQASSRGGP